MSLALVLFLAAGTAHAAVIEFNSDPFAGTTALTTPGRQIVGGATAIPIAAFDFLNDQFVFDPDFFAVSGISFVNDEIGNVPSSGVNTIVLRTFDNDADSGTPFGAGNAANLIAAQITSPGAGFFVYFNSGLNLPRLVYSTDLDDPDADLRILAAFTAFTGDTGALVNFSAANFDVRDVPEPASLLLLTLGAAWAMRRRS
jgi:hypothetical protein